MIEKIFSIIPFDSIKKWLSENPEIALLLLILVLILSFVGGFCIA